MPTCDLTVAGARSARNVAPQLVTHRPRDQIATLATRCISREITECFYPELKKKRRKQQSRPNPKQQGKYCCC